MKPTEVAEDALPRVLKTSPSKVLIEVYATWCEPCERMRPILDAVAAETKDCEFYLVDIDEAPTFSAQFAVEVVPTFLIFERGVLVSRLVGPKTKAALTKALS